MQKYFNIFNPFKKFFEKIGFLPKIKLDFKILAYTFPDK